MHNYNTVLDDVKAVQTAWNSSDYNQLGDKMADILVLVIGPVPATEAEIMPENLKMTQW